MSFKPETIKGLEGKEPIGAVVSIGVKDKQRSFPTETDRFHIVLPHEENGVRPLHPSFSSFNSADPKHRKALRGNLMHATRSQCFEYHLKAQVLRGMKAHPNRRPACVGDGVRALRWTGKDPDDFIEIKCPHDRCEFRQGTPPSCKPFARFLFRLRWKDESHLPTPLVKFTTGSWYTTQNIKGFFKHIEEAAQKLIGHNYNLYGFPFTFQLTRRTKPSAHTSFPVVEISPEQDPVQFFHMQREQIRKLQEPIREAITDQSQQDNSIVYEDIKSISVPSNSQKD